ncbi:MAG: hypothetical protein KAI73_05110 [Rhodospirillaceae bacterium]|nr:hypothetical protein [Rhodospirillaceae bacterium]
MATDYMAVYAHKTGWGRACVKLSKRFKPDDAAEVERAIREKLGIDELCLTNLIPEHKWWQFWK